MNIAVENLDKVKKAFENKVEYGKVRIDSDFPFFNAYNYKGEILFSNGYKTYHQACEFADQEHYKEIPECWNAFANRVQWVGVLRTDRFFLAKN